MISEIFYNQNFSFVEKAQQIQCEIHQIPIVLLDIGFDTQIGQRLLCTKCSTHNKEVLNLEFVQNQMKKWNSDEQILIKNIYNKLNEVMNSFDLEIKQFSNMIESFIKTLKSFLYDFVDFWKKMKEKCLLDFEAQMEKKKKTKFQEIYQQFASSPMSVQKLQNIALFISQQNEINQKDLTNLQQQIIPPNIIYLKYQSNIKKITENLNEIVNRLKIEEDHDIKIQMQLNTQPDQPENTVRPPTLNICGGLRIFQNKNKSTYPFLHQNDIRTIAISNDDQLLASSDNSGLIILWQTLNKQKIQQYQGECDIQQLLFSDDSKLLAAAQSKSPYQLIIFDISDKLLNAPKIVLKGHLNSIRRIQFTSDSQNIISISEDKTLKICNLTNFQFINFMEFSKSIYGMSLSQNQNYISVCGEEGIAYLLDSRSLKQLKKLVEWQAHEHYAYGIISNNEKQLQNLIINYTTFTQDSKNVLTSYTQIKLWSIDQLLSMDNNKVPLKIFKGEKYIWNLQILGNGSDLVTYDGKIKILNLYNEELFKNQELPDLKEQEYGHNNNYAVTSNKKLLFLGEGSLIQVYKLN